MSTPSRARVHFNSSAGHGFGLIKSSNNEILTESALGWVSWDKVSLTRPANSEDLASMIYFDYVSIGGERNLFPGDVIEVETEDKKLIKYKAEVFGWEVE